MTTAIIEGKSSYFFATQARLLDDSRDIASSWASEYIVENPAIKWVIANYVEADNANSNGQYWQLEDLRMKRPTINHSPMNWNHQQHNIVGAFVGSELVYPLNEGAGQSQNPYIETVGAFWKFYFPEQAAILQAAYSSGALFVSMECVASSITCIGDGSCGETFEYAGPKSETYCDHVNNGGVKQLNDPHFLAGGLITPPNRPGWKGASVKELSELVAQNLDAAEDAYNMIASEAPHLEPKEWERLMFEMLAQVKAQEKPEKRKLPAALMGQLVAQRMR